MRICARTSIWSRSTAIIDVEAVPLQFAYLMGRVAVDAANAFNWKTTVARRKMNWIVSCGKMKLSQDIKYEYMPRCVIIHTHVRRFFAPNKHANELVQFFFFGFEALQDFIHEYAMRIFAPVATLRLATLEQISVIILLCHFCFTKKVKRPMCVYTRHIPDIRK